ncbi:MAG: hypothetical protein JRJ69_11320 [Deltaproteobacteria bacterium]|nr:hypothetical protein [Deltaproteobacteria bacterium]
MAFTTAAWINNKTLDNNKPGSKKPGKHGAPWGNVQDTVKGRTREQGRSL